MNSTNPIQEACTDLRAAYAALKLETTSRGKDSLCAMWQKRVELGICFLEDFCDDFGVYRPGTGSLDSRAYLREAQDVRDILSRVVLIHKGVTRCHALISECNHLRNNLDVRSLEKINQISRQFRATQELYSGICPIKYSIQHTLSRRTTRFAGTTKDLKVGADRVGYTQWLRWLSRHLFTK
ncbi:hypothetical protein BJX64DRAFT_291576 [Aspergillus heterothallicus]